MNVLNFSILTKLRMEYKNLYANDIMHHDIQPPTFNEWLSEQYGFHVTDEYIVGGDEIIVITNPKKKLLFDIKYPHE